VSWLDACLAWLWVHSGIVFWEADSGIRTVKSRGYKKTGKPQGLAGKMNWPEIQVFNLL